MVVFEHTHILGKAGQRLVLALAHALCLLTVAPACHAGPNAVKLPALGYNNYLDTVYHPSWNQISNAAVVLKNTGLWDFGYRTVVVDEGWCTNFDAAGNFMFDYDKWPGGFPAAVTNLHAMGFKVGVWMPGVGNEVRSYINNKLGTWNITNSLVQQLSWGLDYLKCEWNDATKAVSSGLIPTILNSPNGSNIFLETSSDIYSVNTYMPSPLSPEVWNCSRYALGIDGNPETPYFSDAVYTFRFQNWLLVATNFMGQTRPGYSLHFDALPFDLATSAGNCQRLNLAVRAVFSSPILLGTLGQAADPYYLAYLTNADVLGINQDTLMAPPSLVQQHGTPTFFCGTDAINAYAKTISGNRKAVALANFNTVGFSHTTMVLQMTNLGYLPGQTVLVKDCYYPKYGHWGTAAHNEPATVFGPDSGFPPAYYLGTHYSTLVASLSASLLIASPSDRLPVSGSVSLINWSYFTKTLVTNSDITESACVQRNMVQGHYAPGYQFGTTSAGAYTNSTNFIAVIGNQQLSWCVTGATNFSCQVGIPWNWTTDWGYASSSPMTVVWLTNGNVAASNWLARSAGVKNVSFPLVGVNTMEVLVSSTNDPANASDWVGIINSQVNWPEFMGMHKLSSKLTTNDHMQLSFQGSTGSKYALERTFSLSPVQWIPILTNPADDFGKLTFTNMPDRSTNNFWRIRSVP